MAAQAPTIIDLKSSFLRSQIISLSQSLRPTAKFLDKLTSSEEDALRQKSIDDALAKLNAQIKRHNKLVYGPQAIRHVAEQIDALYWGAGERSVIVGGDLEWGEKGDSEIVKQLPEEWSEGALEKAPEQASRYSALQKRLVEVNEKRRAAKEKVEGYQALGKLVGMFGEDGVVQENLVTKGGEVERELERMRMLMLRVERGLEGMGGGGEEEKEMNFDFEGDGERRLEDILR